MKKSSFFAKATQKEVTELSPAQKKKYQQIEQEYDHHDHNDDLHKTDHKHLSKHLRKEERAETEVTRKSATLGR